jgi:valyl-tRNA synthetase
VTLRVALSTLLRLLAPVLPYVTEEVWSWWHEGSVHRAPWPTHADVAAGQGGDAALLGAVGAALAGVRKAKSEAKVGMRAEVASIMLAGPDDWADRVRMAELDLRAAGRITGDLSYGHAEAPEVREPVLIPVQKATS